MNIFKFQFLYWLGRNIPDLATKRLPRIKSNYLLKMQQYMRKYKG